MDDRLDPGLVFALTAFVWEPGAGAALVVDPIHLSERGPELLTSNPEGTTGP